MPSPFQDISISVKAGRYLRVRFSTIVAADGEDVEIVRGIENWDLSGESGNVRTVPKGW